MKTLRIKHFLFFITSALILSTPGYAADYPAPGDFQKGAKTWADNCGRCHNIRGAKELKDDQWISTMFHMRMRAGLTGQETRDVITFLQGSNTVASKSVISDASETKPKNQKKGPKLSGKSIYTQTCVACHSETGTGAFPGVPDFTNISGVLKKSDATLRKHITEGFQSPGSPMAMPPKGGNPSLTDDDVKSVLGYIKSTFGKK
ncbi:MAG: c-type cytochrome [Gammaproteobacteria bacterium]|nr:c-type cytochrome [Gammaproteobacteria bacterium]